MKQSFDETFRVLFKTLESVLRTLGQQYRIEALDKLDEGVLATWDFYTFYPGSPALCLSFLSDGTAVYEGSRGVSANLISWEQALDRLIEFVRQEIEKVKKGVEGAEGLLPNLLGEAAQAVVNSRAFLASQGPEQQARPAASSIAAASQSPTCTKCGAVLTGGLVCTNCGETYPEPL